MKQVQMLGGVNYERITPQGLYITYGDKRSDGQLIECDSIIICAGQEPQRELLDPLRLANQSTHLIGGADLATELDAKRAIDQGTRLALRL
jgi:2,4-dienoyl-CoA reductase (NADPH2)